jgi:ubiquinone/menaquinone biosynthesis C-methylase UbiE
MTNLKNAVEKQFSQTAENYRKSAVHARGADLAKLVEVANLTGSEKVLDVGCGAGHTTAALAPYAQQVVALDLSQAMLAQVNSLAAERGLINIETRQGDAEHLPFDDSTFDLVVSRYSAHHWPNPQAVLRAIWRVLKPNGCFILSDTIASENPLLDTFLQTLEVLRDGTHVRDYRFSEWQQWLGEVGFESEVVFTFDIFLDFADWVARMATPELNIQMLRALYRSAPSEVREYLKIQPNDDFTIYGGIIRSVKQGV